MNESILYIIIIVLSVMIVYLLFKDKNHRNQDDSNDILHNLSNIKSQIDEVYKSSESTGSEVLRLHTLLTGSSTAQGKLGENSCEKVLENAGLIKNSTYFCQHTVGEYKLDFLVILPGDRKIIIDSKVSLSDFSNYINESSSPIKEEHLKKHKKSVTDHIKTLSKYRGVFPNDALDLTIMYMPREEMFVSAISEGLIDQALKSKIAIVGPTTLIAVIQIIQKSWSSYKQNENIGELIKAASSIYEAAAGVGESILGINKNYINLNRDVGISMQRTKKLVKKIEEFRIIDGLEPKKDIPQNLKDQDNE